jgi:hypothetical protein
MRELTHLESGLVAGGDLTCTASIGTGGLTFSCTGSPEDFGNAFSSIYESLVSATTDLMCSWSGKC